MVPVEPVSGQTANLKGPNRDGDGKDQNAVELVIAGFASLGVYDVAGYSPSREDKLNHEEGGKDGQRGEKPCYGLRRGELE